MSLYYVNATPAATAATIDHAILQIWNPSGARSIELLEVSCVFRAAAPAAGAGFTARRSTARGTAGSTVTPGAAHHSRNQVAPDSGFLVDLAAFTAQPTLAAGDLHPTWAFSAVQASGVILPLPRGIEIPPNTGLVFTNTAAVIFAIAEWGLVVAEK